MTKKNRNIDSIIKESFDGMSKKAPEGLWENISHTSSMSNEEKLISDILQDNEIEAPNKVWSNVRRQLIIDDVWEGILAYQNRRRRRAVFFIFSVLSMTFLIGSIWLLNSKLSWSVNHGRNMLGLSRSALVDEINAYGSTLKSSHVSSLNKTEKSNVTKEESRLNELLERDEESLLLVGDKTFNGKVLTNSEEDKLNIDIEENKFDAIHKLIDPSDSIVKCPSKLVVRIDLEYPDPKLIVCSDSNLEEKRTHFEVGLVAGLENTWLFNNDVINGFNSASLVSNKLSAGYNFGIVANYHLNDNIRAELDFDFYSVLNQRYSYFEEGRFIDKRISIREQKIGISVKSKLKTQPLSKMSVLLKGGMFYSYGMHETILLDDRESLSPSIYSRSDYGLSLGVGIEKKFSNITFEYGLNTDVGLKNISADKIGVSKKINTSNTWIIGGYVMFKYSFAKK